MYLMTSVFIVTFSRTAKTFAMNTKDMYMVSKILRLPAMDNALEEPGIPPELPEARGMGFIRG
jgi:hypothetical protein